MARIVTNKDRIFWVPVHTVAWRWDLAPEVSQLLAFIRDDSRDSWALRSRIRGHHFTLGTFVFSSVGWNPVMALKRSP